MAKSRVQIFNLLKPVELPKTSWDKIYEWLVGKARVVILFVEILIITAFISKVIVDNIGKNKEKEYENLAIEMKFYEQKYESIFRKLQRKDIEYKKLWGGSKAYSAIIEEIFSYIPNPNDQVSVTIDNDRVTIFGYEDLNQLRELEASLKSSNNFSDAFIDRLSLEQQDVVEGAGQYILTAVIKPENLKRASIL
jgi:hypothetical protein